MSESIGLEPNQFANLKPYCSDESIAYLKQSLNRLLKGNPPTPSFPLYGIRDSSIFDKADDVILKSPLPEWLVEYEKSRKAKFGPQGGTPKWADLQDNFLLYQTALKDVKYIDEDILSQMVKEYHQLRCAQLSAVDALDHLKRSNKIETRAAGWSEFQLKKTDPKAQSIAMNMLKSGNWIHGYGYVFSRFSKQKNRIFMPMPFSSMINQARWYVPFLGTIQTDLLQKGARSPYVFWADKIGFEKCFDLMEDEINAKKPQPDEYLVYFSNDFEKMDTRTGTSQYKAFFLPILHAAFGNTTMDEAMLFTTTAPIISPMGTMVGDHGTASGAEVTNGGETVCNDYFQRRLLKVMQDPTHRVLSRRGNGDDSIIIFAVKKSTSFPDFEQKLRSALEQVCGETGFDAQTEKLDISTTFGKYCQNVLEYRDGKLFWCYPLTLVLNSIMNPEKQYAPKDWDKDYRDIDIVQKLDNASRHPNFEAFIEFVKNGMRYPLMGASESETARILSKYDKYRSLQSLGERYNRADWNITESPTIRYLLAHR